MLYLCLLWESGCVNYSRLWDICRISRGHSRSLRVRGLHKCSRNRHRLTRIGDYLIIYRNKPIKCFQLCFFTRQFAFLIISISRWQRQMHTRIWYMYLEVNTNLRFNSDLRVFASRSPPWKVNPLAFFFFFQKVATSHATQNKICISQLYVY